jgi:hypothetical protein
MKVLLVFLKSEILLIVLIIERKLYLDYSQYDITTPRCHMVTLSSCESNAISESIYKVFRELSSSRYSRLDLDAIEWMEYYQRQIQLT